MLRPLLTSLAVAHLRLGADGVALAYATAAAQVVFQRGPPVAAFVAAQVLNRLGLKTGACSALYMVRCQCMLCMHTCLHTTPVLMLPRPLRCCSSGMLSLRKCCLSDLGQSCMLTCHPLGSDLLQALGHGSSYCSLLQ